MHFDNKNGKIFVRTYSPSLDDYNAKDEKDIEDEDSIIGEEEFIINYADLGIKPIQKQIETIDLDVNVYSNDIIAKKMVDYVLKLLILPLLSIYP